MKSPIKLLRLAGLIGVALLNSACSSLIASQASTLTDGLASAVLDSEDLMTVEQGAPAYLLLIDGLIEASPDNADMLMTGAQLNSAYAAAFVKDDARGKLMTDKALNYALKAACIKSKALCDAQTKEFDQLQDAVTKEQDIDTAYQLGVAWIGWLMAHSDDWNAIAQLPRAKAFLDRVIVLDEEHELGNAHLYLGGLATLLPPAMGGQPETGREHFEAAIRISEGKNLLAKVIYAQQYARLVFDQELHDQLLQDVLDSEARVEGLTLTNLAAQREAQILLDESPEYF